MSRSLLAILLMILFVLCLCCLALLCLAAGGAVLWETPLPLGSTATPPPTFAPPPTSTPPPAATLPPIVAPDEIALQTEARLNQTIVPIHDPLVLQAELTGQPAPPLPQTARAYQVGDRRTFQLDNNEVQAELIHVTEHTYVWLVSGIQADPKALIDAADRFEAEIYPVVHRYFGSEWTPGVDGDPRLSMLHYEDAEDDAAGYFSPDDETPTAIDPSSNATEMFYINLDGMKPGEDYYFAVLAHEFEHMVHWNTDRNEADWLDEGLAELSCRLAGFDPGSSDEAFRRQPDTQLTNWPYDDEDTTVHYGAGYRFALYLWERFGDELIWDLVHHPADGLAALDMVLTAHSAGVTADQVFADWVLVNALDEGEYTCENEDWNTHLGLDASHSQYPLRRSADVRPYGTDYVELTGSGDLRITFQGAPQTQLLPVDPHSGNTAWWSNEGNRVDARLMRRFDLSGLSRATLRFWMWYDTERGYDDVYLSASRDGRTWQVLQGRYTSRRADYGWAYNGRSNGWLEEEIDLSAYAGGTVWIRFDYVTDGSINGAGFLLDDVSIPELGLSDPCEEESDWQAEGFVLVGPALPQRWAVQIIEFPNSGTPRVRRMEMDNRQAGQLDLTLGGDIERAILAISAMARYTTTPAAYEYEITYR